MLEIIIIFRHITLCKDDAGMMLSPIQKVPPDASVLAQVIVSNVVGGYAGHSALVRTDSNVQGNLITGCWAFVRRKFMELVLIKDSP